MTLTHKHHIIPKHMGGTDDPSNIIELSVEDHAEAHKKLWEEYGKEEDRIAWMGLSGMIGKEEVISLLMRLGQERGRENRGPMSEESKEKLRLLHLGKPKKPEAVEKMRKKKLGVPMSPESSEKKRKSMLQKIEEGWKPGVSHAPKTEEHKKKNSESCKKSWDEGTRKAREFSGPTTEEGKKKCSERAKERWRQYRISKGLDPDTPMKKKSK